MATPRALPAALQSIIGSGFFRGPDGSGPAPFASIIIPLNAVVISAETTIWTPAAGKRFCLMGYCLSAGVAAGNVLLNDNTAGTNILVVPLAAVGSPVIDQIAIPSAAIGNVLTATGVATETLNGYVWGFEF